jgi:hypothetical protein
MTVDVTYSGIVFTVSGDYAPYVPANFLDPAEGGSFEDYTISIGENDLTDLLSDDVVQYIMELADNAAGDYEPEPEFWKD